MKSDENSSYNIGLKIPQPMGWWIPSQIRLAARDPPPRELGGDPPSHGLRNFQTNILGRVFIGFHNFLAHVKVHYRLSKNN